MTDPGPPRRADWRPDAHPVHALIQLLEAAALGVAVLEPLPTGFLKRSPATDRFPAAVRARLGAWPDEIGDRATDYLAARGRPLDAVEPVVADALDAIRQLLLVSVRLPVQWAGGPARLHRPADEEALAYSRLDEKLKPFRELAIHALYEIRNRLLALLARAGEPVPDEIRSRPPQIIASALSGETLLELVAQTQPAARDAPDAAGDPRPNAGTPPDVPTVWYHGGQSYSLDRVRQQVVSRSEHLVLQVSLNAPTAKGTSELEKVVSNVSAVIGALVKRFGADPAGPVMRPAKKGNGYFVVVKAAGATSG